MTRTAVGVPDQPRRWIGALCYRVLRIWAWIVCPTCWGRGKRSWSEHTLKRFG